MSDNIFPLLCSWWIKICHSVKVNCAVLVVELTLTPKQIVMSLCAKANGYRRILATKLMQKYYIL